MLSQIVKKIRHIRMEEIEYKLKSKNIILITEAVDRLLNLITENKPDVEGTNHPLTFLKEKCVSENPVISLTASRGFLSLILQGYLEIGPAMSIAMSMLPSAKNYSAITCIISGILALIVEQQLESNNDEEYTCRWSLVSPQHPLVMVLSQHPLAVDNILSQIESLCLYNERISPHSVELMRPLFLWIFCDPNESQTLETYHKAISILQRLEHCPTLIGLVIECLVWQQNNRPLGRAMFLSLYLLNMGLKYKNINFVTTALIVMADLAVEAINLGLDPRPYFSQMQSATSYQGVEICADVLLAILSEAILICPVIYLYELLVLCEKLQTFTYTSISSFIFVSVTLQWLFYPTSLTNKINNTAKNIIDNIYKQSNKNQSASNVLKLNMNQTLLMFKGTRHRIFNYMELITNYEKITSKKELFDLWILKLNNGENFKSKYQLLLFLCAILLRRTDSSNCFVDKLELLKVMSHLCDHRKELAVGSLPVVLNCLKQAKNPMEMVKLLQTIVQLAVIKENVPLIVAVLENLKNDKSFPKSFLINLHSMLVANQTRCYPYLQELLLDNSRACGGDSEWEVLTAKASAIKFLCQERPANFGAEMVPIISGLFNRCTDTSTSTAYCLALEALKGLWDNRVVAPSSTWRALASKIGKDKRSDVQIGICKLLGDIPLMQNKDPEYDSLVSSALSKLWSYVVDSHHPGVTVAALDALGNYKISDMSLKGIPEIYRKGIQLPSEFCKTPSDAARKPEDVLNYIPNECWANLFKHTNQDALEGVSNFCHKQMVREISQYRSGVYAQGEAGPKGEPLTPTYLPVASLVRGLMDFVRKEALNPSYNCLESSFVECLHCLSRPLPQPLPPMIWNFLPDLWARGSHYKSVILPLATQQASISYTCIRFLQNYIPCLDVIPEREDELFKLLEVLPEICTILQPDFIRGTFSKLFNYSMTTKHVDSVDESKTLFSSAISSMKLCLQNNKIIEDNRVMIADIIEQNYEQFKVDDIGWSEFAEACCDLPQEYIERLTSPSSWWEVTDNVLRKAIAVRSLLAIKSTDDNGLVWLNEVIDASILLPRQHMFTLQNIYNVIMKYSQGFEDWLLQLLARTQVHMVEPTATEQSVVFLCDVVIISVIMSSNYYIYTWRDGESLTTSKAARLTLFPQALYNILYKGDDTKLKDNCGQILEWLHHTRNNKLVPPQYAEHFYLALISCKCDAYFRKQNVWTKFLSPKPAINAL